ncbi:MAG: flippase-like domain-containing protein [bacterium]|nr:flippase-like domain-containing protein [bacterium]
MRYLKIFLIIGLVAVLLYFFLQNVDFSEVTAIIKGVNPIYPIVFFLGLFLQYFIRAYRWGILLRPHKKKISLFTLYNYTVIGFFINILIPGRIGEPARGILLAEEEKINKSYGLASIFLERLIDINMIVLLFLVSLFFIRTGNLPLLAQLKKASYIVLPVMLMIFPLLYLVNTAKVFGYVERIVHFFSKIFPARMRERAVLFTLDFIKGLRLELSLLDFIKLSISSAMVWIALVPVYWFLMLGFQFGSGVGILESIPYLSLVVASAAIPTPGMAGSLDAASRHGLEKLYGVGTNEAAAYTILAHFLIIAVMFFPGLLALWTKGLKLNRIRHIKDENTEENTNESTNEITEKITEVISGKNSKNEDVINDSAKKNDAINQKKNSKMGEQDQ